MDSIRINEDNYKTQTDSILKKIDEEENKPFISLRPNGIVRAIASSVFENDSTKCEDKVTIALNIQSKFKDLKETHLAPEISFFGLFDATFGPQTAERLRDHLCKYIIEASKHRINMKLFNILLTIAGISLTHLTYKSFFKSEKKEK